MRLTVPWRRRARVSTQEKQAATGFIALQGAAEAQWTGTDYLSLAREGFMGNAVAHRCVRLLAEAAAAVPWLVSENGHEIEDHPVRSLLDAPNSRQAGPAFMEALYGHLLIAGNAYVELVEAGGEARELHLLRPDKISIVTDESGWPVALDHRSGSAKRCISLEQGSALHLSLFHPLDDLYGFAPLAAARTALDTHNAASRWNKALLDNSARPSGALVYAPKEGGNLSPDQFDRLKAQLEEGYAGAKRAGRPMLLEGGLDWKAMSLSPRDMDFGGARDGAAREIALAFGVPPMLLGIPGDNTYANYQEANRAFYRLTVLPMLVRTGAALSGFLSQAFVETIRLWFDADQIEGLSAERDQLWSRVENASFLTEDEKREAVGYGAR
ncbi:phage portal protein [Limoniibacter endophyticus]|uniref:Portal protein n=1 Tax=Limoniibacter endophyticus TaxID=1565040 RepID=A0A8J3DN29_9HYPH|nr:phage portal protein [Limoniibacter endophyticus]GHC69352.1 portal protein [Limoniibacter endophyticus]